MTAIARAKGIDLGRTPWFDLTDLEVWFGDEARIGQKNKLTRRWARLAKGSGRRSRMEWQGEGRRDTRPSAPLDHCCAAWNKLTEAPWTIVSLGLRDWAHEF